MVACPPIPNSMLRSPPVARTVPEFSTGPEIVPKPVSMAPAAMLTVLSIVPPFSLIEFPAPKDTVYAVAVTPALIDAVTGVVGSMNASVVEVGGEPSLQLLPLVQELLPPTQTS